MPLPVLLPGPDRFGKRGRDNCENLVSASQRGDVTLEQVVVRVERKETGDCGHSLGFDSTAVKSNRIFGVGEGSLVSEKDWLIQTEHKTASR